MTINFELYTRVSSETGLGTSLDPESSTKASLVTNLAEKINAHFGAQFGKNYVINNREGSFYVRFNNSETREISYVPLDGESEEAELCRKIFNVAVAKKPEPTPATSQDDLKIAALRATIREQEEFFSSFGSKVSDLLDTTLSNQSRSHETSLAHVKREKESLGARIQTLIEKKELLQNSENYWQNKIDLIAKDLEPQKQELADLEKNSDENSIKIVVLKEKMSRLEHLLDRYTQNKTARLDPKLFVKEQAEKYGDDGTTEESLQNEIDKAQARLTTLNERESSYLEKQQHTQELMGKRAKQGAFLLESILNEPYADKKEYIRKLTTRISEYDEIFGKVREKLKETSSLLLQFKREAVTRLEERKQVNLARIAEAEREKSTEPVGSRKIPRLEARIISFREKQREIEKELEQSKIVLEKAEQEEFVKTEKEKKTLRAKEEKAAQQAIEKAAKEAAEAEKREASERAEAEKRAARSATSAMNSPRLSSLDYIFRLASSPSSSS